MNLADYLSLFAFIAIWGMMGINVVLTVGGFAFYRKMAQTDGRIPLAEYPMVSVMVPAHNESLVLKRTLTALLNFDYPPDKYEIILINDNSSDDTIGLVRDIQAQYPDRRFIAVHTDNIVGGKGKSNALNLGLQVASGTVLAIYDADNTPEPSALSILVENLMADDRLAAVIGKFRTRNRNASILTRFVNIETLAYQCMHQAGRWSYFKLCTIPGTNFVIRRSIIESMGGWDPKALAEDTEISFRIYRMGYKIAMAPQAVTWEQEPFTLPIWLKQRTRWVMGNIQVMATNFKYLFDRRAGLTRIDIGYSVLVYVLMLSALVCSDGIFLLGLLGYSSLSLGGLSTLVWVLASVLFTVTVLIALSFEKNEFSMTSAFLILLMLFSYSKMWVVVCISALWRMIKSNITKKETTWYKTERAKE
ncbi:MAG: glycosyltransferase family 2 protein [Oscillospiraceae bacterium]|jgi:cellulose synthase/poly-beta-1,6-N-acetylglucosamine synthase-like glycosyltransferase|nr:glycosyltransferase family 2 protein [Oscillospiraceae bacterium]